MFIWIAIAIIALISIALSFLSLRGLRGERDIKNAKKDLSKNRILYQDSESRGE